MYLALSGGSRIVGQHIGEMTRPKWQVRARALVCVGVWVCACVRACVHACMWEGVFHAHGLCHERQHTLAGRVLPVLHASRPRAANLPYPHPCRTHHPPPQGLPDPASLAPVHIPRPAALAKLQLPRRIKKKVSKRVPKYQAQQQQQQQQPSLEGLEQQFGGGAMAASMAATAAAPVPTQMPQLEVAPLSGEASHEEASSMQADAQQQAYEWDGQQQQQQQGGGYEAAYASSSSSALQGEGLAADGGYVQQQQPSLGEQQVVLGSQGSESEEQHSGRHAQQHRPQYH